MIRPCYRTGSHDGALLALYEEYARLVDAEAEGAHSSADIFITGRLAPPPAALVAAAGAGKMLNGSAPVAASGRLWVVPGLPPARHSAGGAGSVAAGVDGGGPAEDHDRLYTVAAFHRGPELGL